LLSNASFMHLIFIKTFWNRTPITKIRRFSGYAKAKFCCQHFFTFPASPWFSHFLPSLSSSNPATKCATLHLRPHNARCSSWIAIPIQMCWLKGFARHKPLRYIFLPESLCFPSFFAGFAYPFRRCWMRWDLIRKKHNGESGWAVRVHIGLCIIHDLLQSQPDLFPTFFPLFSGVLLNNKKAARGVSICRLEGNFRNTGSLLEKKGVPFRKVYTPHTG